MKRRCVPLRADHNLLTPDTHTLSGVRLHPVVQVRSEVVASLSGHLSDLSSSKPALGSTRRRTPAASPTRRLRFEDETETEAESRYLERQRRRAGQRGTGVLVSKPDLKLYVNGRARALPQGAGAQGVQHVVDGEQRGRTPAGRTDQFYSLGTVLGDRVNLNVHLHQPVPEDRGRSLHRSRLNLRTETIRETYIGSVTPGETRRRGGSDQYLANKQVRGMMNEVELNGNQVKLPEATPTADLPINPYAPTQPSDLAPPISKGPSFLCPPSTMMSQSIRLNVTKSEKSLSQSQEERERPATSKPHKELQSRGEVNERSPCVEEIGVELRMKDASFFSSSTSVTTAESQAPPTSDSNDEGQVRQPLRAELHSNDTSLPEPYVRRDESSHLSLRRLLSTVRLSRTRTGSLDRLSSQPRPSTPDPSPSCPRKSSGLLKKTLSVQALSVQGSPFLQLRKSSSVQTVVSEQKKNKDRSADYRPATDQIMQRCLSLEDVGSPSSVRSVGRVLQVCSDGTILLEMSRPKSRKFGFIISRGRGRPDSGVYVEDMVDSSTEKLYAGLLAVGDEILEVNGEKVACLSLDQVTHLLSQDTSATVRVLRHWRKPPR